MTGSRKAGVWRGVIVAVGAGFMWSVGERVGNILMMMIVVMMMVMVMCWLG